MKRVSHSNRHFALSYPLSLGERLYSMLFWPVLSVVLVFLAVKVFSLSPIGDFGSISFYDLFHALISTASRLGVAYFFALICAIPLAILATSSAWAEKIFLPTFDVIESVPVLAFFPVLIIFFLKFHFLNGAAIFILFLSMVWNIVFTVVGGLKIIPRDIIYVAHVFKIKGYKYLRQVILPSIFPEIVTGSLLAVAQGWNLIIVAEVMHTYIPGGTSADDLFGIGSILVKSSASGQTNLFIASIAVMVLAIAVLNFFVWQKLLHYAQRFRFE